MKSVKTLFIIAFSIISYSCYCQPDIETDGSIKAQSLILSNSFSFRDGSGNNDFSIRKSTISSINMDFQSTDGGLSFWTGFGSTALRFMIDAEGKVGIGGSVPESRLQVFDGEDVSLIGNGYFMLGHYHSSNLTFDNNELMARNNGAYSSLYFQKDGGDLLLCGDENGQVGIGVGNASNLPHPDYLLAVDGKIATEDILV